MTARRMTARRPVVLAAGVKKVRDDGVARRRYKPRAAPAEAGFSSGRRSQSDGAAGAAVRGATPAASLLARLERSRLYSEDLGIDLSLRDDRQYFRWFLASLLFGGRISEIIARQTYRAFCRHRLTTPGRILTAGWEFLVNPIMREGGYVRYDFSKSEQILTGCKKLVDEYDGSLLRLHERARDARDLEARLFDFHGVGPVTANIFLRELRPFWPKADPAPLPIVTTAAAFLGIDLSRYERKTVAFARVEAGLIRLRRQFRRRAAAIVEQAAETGSEA